MSQTITAPAGLRTEEGTYGIKYLFIGDDFIGSTSTGTTRERRTAFSVRDSWLGGNFADDQAAIDALVKAYRPAPHEAGEVYRETYRGIEFVVTFVPGEKNRFADHFDLVYNGQRVDCPKGDVETVAKKVRGWVDTRHSDAEMLPKLVALVDALQSVKGLPGWDNGAAPKVGDVAYVYAQGRYRRGLVTKVAKTRATVSYTTASSQGRVYHKADKHDELAAG